MKPDQTQQMSREEEKFLVDVAAKGATIPQLAKLFGMTAYRVTQKLVSATPAGTRRGGHPVYLIKDVAPLLVAPQLDEDKIVEVLSKMNPADLPKNLQKEFWSARRERQRFEYDAGDLWRTATVVEKVGALYKLVVVTARLTSDAVERQVELTDRQRQIVKDQLNGMLANLKHKIEETFGKNRVDTVEDDDDSL